MAYPIDVQVEYRDGTRSRGYAVLGIIFLKSILLIPHLIALWVVNLIAAVAAWIGYWAILFTGRQPEGISSFLSGSMRWYTRSVAWIVSTYDEYPEFGFDDGSSGSQTRIDTDSEDRNRLLAALGIIFFLKALVLLPHLIVVAFLQIAATIAAWIGYWAIAFTGELPLGIHEFLVGVLRWQARATAWLYSLTDEYPPFSMD
jgi:hypothetical protein